ncbi:phosphatase PAP2 family protein [Hymenobacter cellulosivorans]|uniref:Phosphatase PAP2 family protein n=1 Tax=Hymenobacter cellulosivorans TaxID=2932249 RepID=A0ABY4FGS9_9BACT|nr:phosphatase PAP2 family protein [Hymenobacter cellulosivorans]UOQ53666.1 phosphatase PAP2 family protein [Hymenobacter cellulosivorans]
MSLLTLPDSILHPLLVASSLTLGPGASAEAAARPIVAAPDSGRAEAVALAAADTTRRPPRRSDYLMPSGVTYHYERPKPFRFLLNIPRDVVAYPKFAFQKKNLPVIGGVVVSTVVLYAFDQQILDGAKQFGRHLHLSSASTQTTLFDVPVRYGNGKQLDLEFNYPSNLNSAMYFLGDGWTHLSIAGSFWAYGLIGRDNRASQTASQVMEAVYTNGLVVQVLKHLTGRESPYTTTYPRGKIRLFPNQKTYSQHVPNYDAYPSGHLSTAMATVTVIAENYPEYRFVRPVGYSLMGLLSYAMLNNGVHWASDYPLALALGYGFGKIAVMHGRQEVKRDQETGLLMPQPWYKQVRLTPTGGGGSYGLTMQYRW